MTPELVKRLKKEVPDEKLDKLLKLCVSNVNRSRAEMKKHYSAWDKALDTYRTVRTPDAEDYRARQKREPEKMTVPMSYAQVNTLVTFLFLSFTQRESIFELNATGNEDYDVRDQCQAVIDRELRQTKFTSKLVSALLDMARCNLGVLKTSWKYESIEVEPELDFNMIFNSEGVTQQTLEGAPEEVIVCEGNYVENISPYNFFYDVRLPLTRWKEGRFAADETQVNLKELEAQEKDGRYAGTEFVQSFDKKSWNARREATRLDGVDPVVQRKSQESRDFMCALVQQQIKLIPADYDLSESDREEIWIISYVNDNRIVAVEPLNAPHYEFQYDLLTLLPDQHAELCDSLSMLIDPLQEVITWLLNSRIASVRTNIEGRYVVDPTHVDTGTLTAGNKYILLKKNAPRLGVDKFMMQLKTVDPTQTHIQDAQTLMQVMQLVSGVNENSMGQVAPGRRSATENRSANAGAAARMKLTGSTVWTDAIASCGRKMLLNCRQDLSFETYEKIVGPETAVESYEQFHQDGYRLVGNEDYFTYDGTLSSEKNYIAQSLQELVVALISNPEVAMQMNLDIPAMIEEIQSLRGVKNLERFKLAPQPQTTLPLPNGQPGQIPPPAGAAGPTPAIIGQPTLPTVPQ